MSIAAINPTAIGGGSSPSSVLGAAAMGPIGAGGSILGGIQRAFNGPAGSTAAIGSGGTFGGGAGSGSGAIPKGMVP